MLIIQKLYGYISSHRHFQPNDLYTETRLLSSGFRATSWNTAELLFPTEDRLNCKRARITIYKVVPWIPFSGIPDTSVLSLAVLSTSWLPRREVDSATG